MSQPHTEARLHIWKLMQFKNKFQVINSDLLILIKGFTFVSITLLRVVNKKTCQQPLEHWRE